VREKKKFLCKLENWTMTIHKKRDFHKKQF